MTKLYRTQCESLRRIPTLALIFFLNFFFHHQLVCIRVRGGVAFVRTVSETKIAVFVLIVL